MGIVKWQLSKFDYNRHIKQLVERRKKSSKTTYDVNTSQIYINNRQEMSIHTIKCSIKTIQSIIAIKQEHAVSNMFKLSYQ